MDRRPLIAILLVAITIVGFVLTYSYQSSTTKSDMVITVGDLDIVLNNMISDQSGSEAPFPETGYGGIFPGSTVMQSASVSNIGTHSAWVRIRINSSLIDGNGNAISSDIRDENNQIISTINPNICVNTQWEQGSDDYWYYKIPLPPEETTDKLFNSVSFAKALDNDEYIDYTADLSITVHTVQSKNNSRTYADVVGWPE